MTSDASVSPIRTVCGHRASLPTRLVVSALKLTSGRGIEAEDVQTALSCSLEEHTTGAHWCLVADPSGPGTEAVWAPWIGDSWPTGVVLLPDCEATSSDSTRTACCEFAAHPGAHSWEVQDRPETGPRARATRKSTSRVRTKPSRLHQEPESVTWAREKAGLTKRALADLIGVSEQLMGEIESGWRSATPANLTKIAVALNCPVVSLERKRAWTSATP